MLSQTRNYLPVDIETKYQSCLRRVKSGWSIKKIIKYYHVKRQSLYRWLKVFDGTKESLINKSHRPIREHPNKIKEEIVERILNLHRRNPNSSYLEIWVRLRRENIEISASSVLRIFKRNKVYLAYKPNKKVKHDKVYDTPKMVHEKWQIDVKYVPRDCKASGLEGRYYQYTILDECSRKRYLYYTNEHSMYETVSALKEAVEFFDCYPKELQSDNGFEFSDTATKKDKGVNIRKGDNYLEAYLKENNIKHHFIRPRTPEHNGKVERSHRIDQDKFYRYLHFYSLEDLRKQGKVWNRRYNNLPKIVLDYKTPNEVELEKLKELYYSSGEIRCRKCLTSFES